MCFDAVWWVLTLFDILTRFDFLWSMSCWAVLTHIRRKVFKCRNCWKFYVDKSELNKHIKNTWSMNTQDPIRFWIHESDAFWHVMICFDAFWCVLMHSDVFWSVFDWCPEELWKNVRQYEFRPKVHSTNTSKIPALWIPKVKVLQYRLKPKGNFMLTKVLNSWTFLHNAIHNIIKVLQIPAMLSIILHSCIFNWY